MNQVRAKKHGAKPRAGLEDQIFRLEVGSFKRMCEAVDTPRSLACYLLAKYGEWTQYLELDMPDSHLDSFADDYGVSEAMRKNPRLPIDIDRKAAAIEKWWEGESSCLKTNEKFRALSKRYPPEMERVKKLVHCILGELTPDDLAYCESRFRFGPGSTSSVKGKWVLSSQKVTDNHYAVTTYLREFVPFYTQCSSAIMVYQNYNELTTVPKTAKTDRVIAIEPHWNIFVQLGVGALIRRRLRRAGLDCNTQAHNQYAAIVASRRGLATLDLSNASDTLAYEVVRYLLPPKWFQLLVAARVPETLIKSTATREKSLVHLEKFSSMGNGYTWELETLIFWCIARAYSEDDGLCLAYGDDIIVTEEHASRVIQGLEAFGFTVNGRKSYWQGDFRESCGVDVWRGLDVRPYYFRNNYEDIHSAVIRNANGIRRYAARRNGGHSCDRRYFNAYQYCLKFSNQARRTYIPEGYGDGGLVRSWDEIWRRVRAAGRYSGKRPGWEGFLAPTFERRPKVSPYGCSVGALNNWLLTHRNRTVVHFDQESIELSEEFGRGTTAAPRPGHLVVPRWSSTASWSR